VFSNHYDKFYFPHPLKNCFLDILNCHLTYIISCTIITSHVYKTGTLFKININIWNKCYRGQCVIYHSRLFIIFSIIDIVRNLAFSFRFSFQILSEHPVESGRFSFTCQSHNHVCFVPSECYYLLYPTQKTCWN